MCTTPDLTLITPAFPPPSGTSTPSSWAAEPTTIHTLIASLTLAPHIEGGYFAETHRDPLLIPTPSSFGTSTSNTVDLVPQRPGFQPEVRNASTSIFYLLTPSGPQGGFHRNKGTTIHTLHRGRGRYVLIHADEPSLPDGTKRIESFVVGQDVEKGERLQWVVEGGKYKASFLLPDRVDEEGKGESGGLLISETVVPGFEYCDHDFLSEGGLEELVGKEAKGKLEWLLSPFGKEEGK